MSSENRDQLKQDEDDRAVWERPAFRRLVTRYAEGVGIFRSEGVPPGGGQNCEPAGPNHSCKSP